ncbi:MAG: alkanesulfonate monooxygenase SsuD [Candidatus Poriferisodalaceae bacterium]|jgi:alkanesulfonate monooxygenase SsuD/methylene tetrahydromethanopterin reductase-like flavin-dependent oxidoreductase (luciferase family)
MQVGATIFCQNYADWDRYEAEERGSDVPARPETADRSILFEEIEIAKQADRSGFDSVWTIEHHFTPYTMVTNPLQLLTYLAGVTENVDLGTMVVVLPWHNPVRIAEDIVMLDSLLGDRSVIAGVGRGLGRREYGGLGIDQNEARGRFDESIEVLTELLSTGRCSYDGEHFQLDNVRLRPQPLSDLSGTLNCAAGSPETMEIIARSDIQPLMIPTTSLDLTLQGARHFMKLRGDAGLAPTHTKLALWTYCSESEDEARAGAERYMKEYADSALRHYEMTGTHFEGLKGYEGYAERAAALRDDPDPFLDGFFARHPWGTPEMIIEKTAELAEQFGTSDIMFVFRYGGMGHAEASRSMEIFSQKVLPALQELSPAPMALADA